MWFSVDRIVFDQAKNEFRLYIGPKKDLYNQCLKISGVINYQIKDTEKVGIYDINYLSVNAKKGVISIVGCITIKMTLKVIPEFEITLEPTA